MAKRGDQSQVVYVDGDVPQLPIQLGQLLVDSSQISLGTTNLQQCTSQDPLVYQPIVGRVPGDIRNYGAIAGAAAAINTPAIQAAVDNNSEVYVPSGTFSTNTITLHAGLRIYGDGPASILSQNTITDGSWGTLYVNSGSDSATVDGIIIEDLQVLGNVVGQGFSEFQHLISLNGASQVWIQNCVIRGFRGDGIYLGSGTPAGTERHNNTIRILNNVIDGVNNDNRNGVSVIDGDDVLIQGNTFVNCTRSNMPGAVDIEPDSNDFHVVKNIKVVKNHFKDCGGNVACISLVLVSTVFTTQPENFLYHGNTFEGTANGFVVFNNVSSYARPLNVKFTDNMGTVGDPWQVFSYCKGLTITGNQLNFTGDPVFGVANTDIIESAIIANNILTGDGSTTGMVLRSGSDITIADNVFDALNGYSLLVGGAGATLDKVGYFNNRIASGSVIGIQWGGGTVTDFVVTDNDFSAGTAFSGSIPADTRIRNNKGYVSENGGTSAAISSGGTIAHGCAATPTVFSAVPTAAAGDVVVTAGATNLTVTFGGGGSVAFAWEAKTSYHYAS